MKAVGQHVVIRRIDKIRSGILEGTENPFEIDRKNPMEGEVISVGDTCKEIDHILAGHDIKGFSGATIREGDVVQYWGPMSTRIDTGLRHEMGDGRTVRVFYHCVPFGQIMVVLEPSDFEQRAAAEAAYSEVLEDARRKIIVS